MPRRRQYPAIRPRDWLGDLKERNIEHESNTSNEYFFRFRKFQGMLAKLATRSANLHVVFHFLKTFANFRQQIINTKHKTGGMLKK